MNETHKPGGFPVDPASNGDLRRSITAFLKSGWGRFALLLVFLLVLLGFWGLLRAPEEEGPLHDGRSLAQWFHIQRHPDFTEAEKQRAKEAIVEMGTNVIPGILIAMGKPASGRWDSLYQAARKRGWIESVPNHIQWSDARAIQQVSWVKEEVRPHLLEALFEEFQQLHARRGPFDDRRRNLALAIFKFDDQSTRFLGEKLTDSSSQKRAAAVFLLGFVGRPPLEFMETLGSLVEDEDPRVSSHAIWTLQRYRRSSPSIVSSVVHHSRKGLDHEEASVRRSAASALANFGSAAQGALPRLREVSELDPAGRKIILDAIRKMDPELNGE